MVQLLTQKEVDLLLRGIPEWDVEEPEFEASPIARKLPPQESPDGIVKYDLASHNRIIRGRMPALEMVYSRFARIFRQTLSNHLRRPIHMELRATELVNFKDFLNSVSYPSSLNLFHFSPLKGTGMMVLEQKLVYTFIDMLFGGSGELHIQSVKRDFSTIELRMISKVIHSGLEDLQSAWKPFIPLRVKFSRAETNPQFTNIVPDSEVVVVTTFDVEVHQTPMTLSICVPYSMLDPIRSKLNTTFQKENSETDQLSLTRLSENVLNTKADLRVFLGHAKIKLRHFLNLDVGDHLVLNQGVDQPLKVLANNIPKFEGFQGAFNGHLAIRISKMLFEPRTSALLFEEEEAPK
ncbi:MAG: flagellar motor switch protein FliM [SAR324 cluster bacterium]|nr:flagellar motor switch protein FliM [SAR324 cluster bacterium]